jgi:hypothetical protein
MEPDDYRAFPGFDGTPPIEREADGIEASGLRS